MTTKTRYFVIVSLLVLGVGLGTGLVAYYVGFPAGAFRPRAARTSSHSCPRDASVIAFANVHEIMTSELRQKMRRALPIQENGQRELENQTGINIETDIDSVVACLRPDRVGANAGRRHGAGARAIRRSEDRSPDARARRARRDLQRQAAHRADPKDVRRGRPRRRSRRRRPVGLRLASLRRLIHRTRPRRDRAAPADHAPPSTCTTPATTRRRVSKASPATRS